MVAQDALMIKAAIFPGSFDPLTNGHLDIITRSIEIFDHIIIAVLSNPEKETLFSIDERVQLIEDEVGAFGDKVAVQSFSGLLVNFAQESNVRVILRGLRAISDYDYEAQLALMNKNLNNDIETFFLITREKYSYVSSSLVKQVAAYGGSVSKCVSPKIEAALKQKLSKHK